MKARGRTDNDNTQLDALARSGPYADPRVHPARPFPLLMGVAFLAGVAGGVIGEKVQAGAA